MGHELAFGSDLKPGALSDALPQGMNSPLTGAAIGDAYHSGSGLAVAKYHQQPTTHTNVNTRDTGIAIPVNPRLTPAEVYLRLSFSSV